ncbi:conserved hypothetical protein [Clostridium botulinum D str. 1873]|uniref:Uncharacterized protein n=1 Tax=Clostridium botulinum D str. 1873 TaxID=592027 RepID=A0A9P2LKZ4_CLOBO|nr:hypothetical protein [Clostridium botulinum]EES90998.1 conserved hypothetical protein [Clostridium botulinum D str. 1873]QPW56272.1 hypothetical protein IRP61_04845 [Clostridium botulinum]
MSLSNIYPEKYKIEKTISYICNCEYKYFLNKSNVVGIGCGYKIKNGFYTNQLCIQVFVRKKLPLNELNTNDLIPSTYKGIPTDIKETGGFTACSLTQKIRPTPGGYCISNEYNDEYLGTLGCLVTDNKDLFLLSNSHVLAIFNQAPLGTKIIEPSSEFRGNPKTDTIATLSKYIELKFIEGTSMPVNYTDCGIAKIIDKSLVSPKIALVGIPKGLSNPKLNQPVKKVGAISELTTGTVTSIHATVTVNYNDIKKLAIFKEQIFTNLLAQPGDSGAILLDTNNTAIGLLMSGSENVSTFNPIDTVLKELNVNLVTSKI